MMEKRNDTAEKDAAGDAGVLDDMVDDAAGKMMHAGAVWDVGGAKRARRAAKEAATGVNHIDGPGTAVC